MLIYISYCFHIGNENQPLSY